MIRSFNPSCVRKTGSLDPSATRLIPTELSKSEAGPLGTRPAASPRTGLDPSGSGSCILGEPEAIYQR